jgi:hypothetical protein
VRNFDDTVPDSMRAALKYPPRTRNP